MLEPRSPDPRPTRRLPQLDLLRGLAILLVLGRHGVIGDSDAGWAGPLARAWYRFGWTGVDLFFVLSGYLIGGLIFAEIRAQGGLDGRRFLARRAFKILPLYYVYLCLAAVALDARLDGAPLDHWRFVARSLLVGVLNLQNYLGTPFLHTWSLAVEEHFYLLLPPLLWWFGLRGRPRGVQVTSMKCVPLSAGIAIVACPSLRILNLSNRNFDLYEDMFRTHLRIDGLLFGVAIAYVGHFRGWFQVMPGVARLGLLAAGLGLITPMAILDLETSWFVPTLGFTFLYVGYGLILVAFLTTPIGPDSGSAGRLMSGHPARLVGWIGVYSYAIYLFHADLVRESLRIVLTPSHLAWMDAGTRWCLGMAVYIASATIVGVAFSWLVERPVLKFRERHFPPRSRP